MKKYKAIYKCMLSVLLCSILLVALSFSISANEYGSSSIEPRYDSINTMDCHINFDVLDGEAGGVAIKKTSASRIEGTLIVYKQSGSGWIYIDQAYKSVTRGTLGVSINFAAESGATYKAVWTVTAYTNNIPETVVIEDIKTCP